MGYLTEEAKLKRFKDMFNILVQMKDNLYDKDHNLIPLYKITHSDKVRKNDDGTFSLIKRKYKKYYNDEWFDKNLINIGYWLYSVYQNNIQFIPPELKSILGLIDETDKFLEEKQIFNSYVQILIKMKDNLYDENGNLINLNELIYTDKARLNDDGTFTLIKRKNLYENGQKIFINRDEYNNTNLINIGFWLFSKTKYNVEKLPENIKNELGLDKIKNYIEENQKKSQETFDSYYKLLKQMKDNLYDENGNNIPLIRITNSDKVRLNSDETFTLIKRKIKIIDGKRVHINKEEYKNHDLINVGSWLYCQPKKHIEDFSDEMIVELGLTKKR